MFRQKTSSSHCGRLSPSPQQGEGRGADSGCCVWAPPGLSTSLPGVSGVRISLPPALPHHCSAEWGGTSQIRRNNGLGRGQVRLRAQQRAGDTATDPKTGRTLLGAVVLPSDSVSPALVGSPQSRALLRWMNFLLCLRHFNFIRARRLA